MSEKSISIGYLKGYRRAICNKVKSAEQCRSLFDEGTDEFNTQDEKIKQYQIELNLLDALIDNHS